MIIRPQTLKGKTTYNVLNATGAVIFSSTEYNTAWQWKARRESSQALRQSSLRPAPRATRLARI